MGILLFIGLVFGLLYYLGGFTKHGETITVPDLHGLSMDRLDEFLADKHLKYHISDSTFDLKKPRGSVIEQDPVPFEKVKENRTIYVTVNTIVPPQVKMPSLEDLPYPYVISFLETYGLKVGGEPRYLPDLAKNRVLNAYFKGKELKTGDKIAKGSVIDLVLGDGLGNTKVKIPQLVGKPLDEVLFVLKASSLNKGVIITDKSIADSGDVFVWKQKPEYSPGATISQGESIDLFVTYDRKKLPKLKE